MSGLNWHPDTLTGWTPERAKACYDACEGVPTEELTPGCLRAVRDLLAKELGGENIGDSR